jgi:hypothetical protein
METTLFFKFFYVYFEGSPPSRRTLGPYARGVPPIVHVPTFPWKYFFSTKWKRSQEIKKESYLHKGRFLLFSCVLLVRFGNTLSP